MTRRKVAIVWGKFDKESDFVLEPACYDYCECEMCKNSIWIEDVPEQQSKSI